MNAMLTTSLCAALALPLAGQTGGGTKPPPKGEMPQAGAADAKPMYMGVEALLGAKVYATGAGGATPIDDAEKLELKDLVVDADSGHTIWAVLEHDGRVVAVPPSLLECSRPADDPKGKEEIELHVEAARLKNLPAFDLEKAREASFDPAVVALESSWTAVGIPTPREAGAPRSKDMVPGTPTVVVTGTEFMTLPARFALASKLDGIDVFARSDDIGDVEDLIVDTKDHRIAYAIVASGGVLGVGEEKYLVPFKALCAGHPKDDKDKTVLVIDLPKDAVSVHDARYEKPETGVLSKERAELADKTFEPVIKAKASRAQHGDKKDKATGG